MCFTVKQKCPELNGIANGAVRNPLAPISEGDNAHYICDDGYGLVGIQRYRQCRGNGTWSSVEPVCGTLIL